MTSHHWPEALTSKDQHALQTAQRKLNRQRQALPQRITWKAAPLHVHAPLRTALELLLMVALPSAILMYFKAELMSTWIAVIAFWSHALELPPVLQSPPMPGAPMGSMVNDGSWLPSSTSLMFSALFVSLLFVLSYRLPDRYFPLRVMIRGLCLIEATSLIFFWWMPGNFPYTVTQHAQTILSLGYDFMLMIAPMLALGWGVLNIPFHQKIIVPFLMAIYFAVMLPHKTLLHIGFLQQTSLLHMPVFFLCFGTLLDLWIFIALYGWLVSTAPASPQAS